MKPDQPNPSEPFPRETIPPDLLEWARQTFDEEEFLADVHEIEATGGLQLEDFIAEVEAQSEVQVSIAVPPPTPYRVEYSERVRQRFLALADIARQRGDAEEYIAALKEFDRRLRIYPQFGEPIVDLKEPGQVWIGIVRPLGMRYGVI